MPVPAPVPSPCLSSPSARAASRRRQGLEQLLANTTQAMTLAIEALALKRAADEKWAALRAARAAAAAGAAPAPPDGAAEQQAQGAAAGGSSSEAQLAARTAEAADALAAADAQRHRRA